LVGGQTIRPRARSNSASLSGAAQTPPIQLRAQDAILFHQVRERVPLLAIQPADQDREPYLESPEWLCFSTASSSSTSSLKNHTRFAMPASIAGVTPGANARQRQPAIGVRTTGNILAANATNN
jgi:hypothetical protein